jgi:hypothetical protein
MYIITTSSYPNDKAKEVAEMYLKVVKQYPEDASLANRVVPVATRTTLEGVTVISVYDIKKGKLEEALTRGAHMVAMFRNIQGYRASMTTFMNLEEGMKTLGM